ncbi:LEAF RUST 10 DISEASE-RESISTANCE LOCUS RECEPTOR-LIKE PROTEIN KINASE-like 2.7 [Zingiber officinale]|uniref:LEAF RUST 10 DISEASE-RESISTANCE LOCUS RECEPTOR-LIKE PROTEIN KINASE-like 2.7 n=1 Tax=Zingiber officinale TaxID=94328 RepID=UPI001C4ABE62|nr:LEAF RUST 10 DISEASE-RESISTANCE LOCUS RECEPTOR-LIKE PROTEIN KINASE-like 2.7 [Zingiber officinale]
MNHKSPPLRLLVVVSSSFLFILFLGFCTSIEGSECVSSCGSITNISYPFRLPDDPSHCGMPQYELLCQHNRTLVNYSSQNFQVVSISYHNQTMRLLDPGLRINNCSSWPISLSSSVDRYDINYIPYPITTVVSFVICQQPVNDDTSYLTTSPCTVDSTDEHHYVRLQDTSVPDYRRFCSYSYNLVDSSIEDGASYLDIWSTALVLGFQVSWKAFQCPICEDAGGSCIYRESFYDYDDSDWCYNPCHSAFQSKHCFFNHLRRLLRDNALKFFEIAGCVWAIRGAPGMLCLLSYLFYKLWKEYLKKNEKIQLFLEKYKNLWKEYLKRHEKIELFLEKYKNLWKKYLKKNEKIELFLAKYKNLTPTRYSYSSIKKMTRGFKSKLGQGGFGTVYKGTLTNGHMVAVKMLGKSRDNNGEEFINEVATIGRVHHVNVVRLIGFCYEGSKRALVYDYMQNGSLDKYIYTKRQEQTKSGALGLEKMYDIALGVARGIEYLHRGCEMQILHFDIKPHNILLDASFTPKISDFGLAKLYPAGNSAVSVSTPKGTFGFIAPELMYRSLGRISYKSDVYSFGRMILEIIGAINEPQVVAIEEQSSEFYFPAWLYDQVLKGEDIIIDVEIEEIESVLAKKLAIVGLWCIQIKPDDRPSMHKVVELLEGSLEDLALPPKPSLLFPSEIEMVEITETESSESSDMLEHSCSSDYINDTHLDV